MGWGGGGVASSGLAAPMASWEAGCPPQITWAVCGWPCRAPACSNHPPTALRCAHQTTGAPTRGTPHLPCATSPLRRRWPAQEERRGPGAGQGCCGRGDAEGVRQQGRCGRGVAAGALPTLVLPTASTPWHGGWPFQRPQGTLTLLKRRRVSSKSSRPQFSMAPVWPGMATISNCAQGACAWGGVGWGGVHRLGG